MKSSVIIKGNKYGFQIVLNPFLPFDQLLEEVAEKFRESMRFFDAGKPLAVSFEGRSLSPEEQDLLVDHIAENSGLSISYIINGAAAEETRFARALMGYSQEAPGYTGESQRYSQEAQGYTEEPKAQEAPETADSYREPSEDMASEKGREEAPVQSRIITESLPEELVGKDGQFYRGTLRSGQKIQVDGSIVVLGDVNPGAQIVAGGNVVILGCLKGTVYAGNPDNKRAFVAALMMEPMQIQIGPCIARSPDHKEKKGRILKKKDNKQQQLEASMAFVENDNIFIEKITRSLISELSIN